MTNDDLKRLYNINAKPQQKKDFVRYDENGRIKAKAGVDDDDVATVGQLGGGTDNALTKPATAPSATQLVAVDNTNTQTMLNLGDGLSIEDGTLKTSGGTSETLYIHTPVVFAENNTHKVITDILIIDKISTDITKDNFVTRMQGDLLNHIASGAVYSNTNEFVGNIVACQYYSPADNFIVYIINSTGEYDAASFSSTSITRVDTNKIGV